MLDQQISEKAAANELRRQQAAEEAQRKREIQRMLDIEAQKEQERKLAEKKRLMAEWSSQSQQTQAKRAANLRMEKSLERNSGMRFDGEDRFEPERRRMQELQTGRWLLQQSADKKRQQEKDRQSAARREAMRREQQQKMDEMMKANADDRHERELEVRRHNASMARENGRLSKLERARVGRSKARANENVKSFWHEDRLASEGEASCLGAHRVRTDHWRGMNAAQKKAIAMENAGVAAANQNRREEEARQKRAYQAQLKTQHRALEISEYEAEQARKTAAKHQLAQQMQHHREAEERKKKELTTRKNIKVDSEFFGAFGTTAR